MLSITDLMQALTEDQVLETFLSNLEAIGVPARSWRVGGVARTILRIVARTYAGFTSVMAEFIKAGFLESASLGWLTLLAYYVYGVSRIDATFATGKAQLTNNGGGIYPTVGTFGIGEVAFRNPTTKKTYTNAEAFSLNPGQTLLVAISATELGTASNSTPGTITELVTPLVEVVVTNPAAVVGTDQQTDPDLRQMCKDKLSALSALGPRGAYAFAIRVARRDDGSTVDVNRWSISPASTKGKVTIYVASSSGSVSSPDLVFILASIERIARPDSVTVDLFSASEVALSKTLTVWATRTDGIAANDIEAFADASLLSMMTDYPIGGKAKPPSTQGYLFASKVESAAAAGHPSIYAVDVAAGDLAINPGEVATLATTITVRLVEAA